MNNGRIWKTAVLAVLVTIAFATFVFRIEEWTKGVRSGFVTLGQTGEPSRPTPSTKIIPQIAVGSFDGNVTKYRTVTEIVNTGSNTISVTGNFYNSNGSLSTMALTTNLSATPFTGTLAATALAANQVLIITGENAPIGTLNWGKIVSNPGTVSVSTYSRQTCCIHVSACRPVLRTWPASSFREFGTLPVDWTSALLSSTLGLLPPRSMRP